MQKILIVDDDPEIINFVKHLLSGDYNLIIAQTGKVGLDMALSHRPDLIILDLSLPDMDGIDLCSKINSTVPLAQIPIIILSSKKGTQVHTQAYEAGSINYIEKPFCSDELKAVVSSVLKQKDAGIKKIVGNLIVDLKNNNVTIDDKHIDLTSKEYKVLIPLLDNINNEVSREDILKAGWHDDHVTKRVVDNNITSLRKKIFDSGLTIEGIYSKGYLLRSIS